MTGITLSTVGYGDVLGVENNTGALYYTMILMIVGMGVVLYSTSLVTAYILEGNLRHAFVIQRIKRRVEKMEEHYVICGAGETGIHVIREMFHTKKPFVIIESQEKKMVELNEEFPKCNVLIGDATSDHLLEQAGISKAKALVACLSSDKDNLYLTVTAKLLNPKLTIIARAVELSMIKKLQKAGAHKVVSPNFIGGMRMASEVLRPNVVGFLDRMLRGRDKSIRVEEVTVPLNSPLSGTSLEHANFYDRAGVNIMALGRKGNYHYNPSPDIKIEGGDVLLYIGNIEQEEKLKELVKRS
jgi:voltage-gated potassium channel